MYLHINGKERDLIAVWESQGLSIRNIAKRLGRSPASVSREIRRNRSRVSGDYSATCAQAKAEKRTVYPAADTPEKQTGIITTSWKDSGGVGVRNKSPAD